MLVNVKFDLIFYRLKCRLSIAYLDLNVVVCVCQLSVFDCSYEPELFPGLIYRMVKPRIVLLIFVSGKVVLTGQV